MKISGNCDDKKSGVGADFPVHFSVETHKVLFLFSFFLFVRYVYHQDFFQDTKNEFTRDVSAFATVCQHFKWRGSPSQEGIEPFLAELYAICFHSGS